MKTRDQVLDLVLAGYSRTEIATKCYITKSAVSYHLALLFQEYEVNSTPKLITAVYRKRAGILPVVEHNNQPECPLLVSRKEKAHGDQ